MGSFMGAYIKRFGIVAYISMGVLIITGIFMTVVNPHYGEAGAFGNLSGIDVNHRLIFLDTALFPHVPVPMRNNP